MNHSAFPVLRLAIVALLAWLGGLVSYLAAAALIWGQPVRGGDLRAVAMWSALAVAIAVPGVYAPLLFAARRRFPGAAFRWLCTPIAILLGVVPLLLIAIVNGARSLPVPETLLFAVTWSSFGAVFGLGFSTLYGPLPMAERPLSLRD